MSAVHADLLEVIGKLVEQRPRLRGFERGRGEPCAEVGGPCRPVRAQETPADLSQRLRLVVEPSPAVDPLVGSHEGDPRALRRSLAQLAEEEGEARAQALSRRGAHALHDFLRELLAQQAAAVQHLPDRGANRLDLLGFERRVNRARGIAPGRQPPIARAGDGAPGRVPERELLRRMEVERSADRPGLDERALLPQRRSDIGLLDSLDPGCKLQLGRCLHLCVDAAHRTHDLDEPIAARAIAERRARQTPRPYLFPADLHTATVVSVSGAG